MTLFSAQVVAVSGLAAQAAAIGNISDSISNASTTAYKGVKTQFESQVTQSTADFNSPGGVRSRPLYRNDVQGNITPSSSSTALAISGSGFFAVRRPTIDAVGLPTFGNDTFFTRSGDFSLNKDGFLINNAGDYLTGYDVDLLGNVNESVSNPIQISALLDNPVATTSASYAATLPANAANSYVSTPSQIRIYDALGVEHTMSFVWTKTSAGSWTLNINIPGGVAPVAPSTTYTDYDVDIPFTFNTVTNPGTLSAISADTAATPRWTVIDNSTLPVNLAEIEFDLSFEGAGTQTTTVGFGTYNSSASGVTQFAGTVVSVNSFQQNGIPSGSFQSLTINKDGFVALNYDNGRVRTVSQIPIVQFFAPNQLERLSGGAYTQSQTSGTPRFGVPGSNGAGSIVPFALEASNVDISDEYTKMIEAQRVYSANAKVVTTTDEMLQVVEQIKR